MRLPYKLKIFLVFFLAILAHTTPTIAAPNEVRIAQLVHAGKIEQAKAELMRSNPSKVDTLFFAALVAKRHKDFASSARLLDQVLVMEPNHLNAHREMAHVLFLAQRFTLAERNIRALQTFDTAPDMQKLYQTMLSQIQTHKPYGVSGRFALLPSSNVNRGTDNVVFNNTLGQFVIDPTSRTTSGIGVQLGLDGYWRGQNSAGVQNSFNWGITSTTYQNHAFDSADVSFQFSQRRLLNPTTLISFGPYARLVFRTDDADRRDVGFGATLQQKLGARSTLTSGARYEYRTYSNQTHNSGQFAQLNSKYSFQRNPSHSYAFGINLARHTPNAEHSAYRGVTLSAETTKAFEGGLVVSGGINYGIRNYDTDFPLFGARREDSVVGANLTLQNNKINFMGFVPKTTCTIQRTTSNIALYDSMVKECHVGVSRRF